MALGKAQRASLSVVSRFLELENLVTRQQRDKNGRSRVRLMIRCCALLASIVLVLPIVPWTMASAMWPSLSPFVLICTAVASWTISVSGIIGIPVLLIVLIRQRWFCRWACPVGLLTETVGRIPHACQLRADRIPRIGRLLALLTLGGSVFGFPLLLWLDPLAIFHGAFTITHEPTALAGRVAAGMLAGLLVGSFVIPGIWCARLCPLGATQDLLAIPARLLRRQASADESVDGGRASLTRRSLMSAGLSTLCIGIGARLAGTAKSSVADDRSIRLRPPGSIDEATFAGTCIRCGNCTRTCPSRIISADTTSNSIANLLTPVVDFAGDYCHEDCVECGQVCPTGAIARLSLDTKSQHRMGTVEFETELCLLYDNRECDKCKMACPYEAIRIVWDEEEYIALPQIDATRCPGCGACEVICPGTNVWEQENSTTPVATRKAIRVDAVRHSEDSFES